MTHTLKHIFVLSCILLYLQNHATAQGGFNSGEGIRKGGDGINVDYYILLSKAHVLFDSGKYEDSKTLYLAALPLETDSSYGIKSAEHPLNKLKILDSLICNTIAVRANNRFTDAINLERASFPVIDSLLKSSLGNNNETDADSALTRLILLAGTYNESYELFSNGCFHRIGSTNFLIQQRNIDIQKQNLLNRVRPEISNYCFSRFKEAYNKAVASVTSPDNYAAALKNFCAALKWSNYADFSNKQRMLDYIRAKIHSLSSALDNSEISDYCNNEFPLMDKIESALTQLQTE